MWGIHRSRAYLVSQARKALFQAYKLSNPTVGKLTPLLAFKVFDSQILPILEYGAEILCKGKPVDIMEKFHMQFLKSTLGVRIQTSLSSHTAIYAETGRFPLIIRQEMKVLKYWLQIFKLPVANPVRQAYTTLKQIDAAGCENWCSCVKQLLGKIA